MTALWVICGLMAGLFIFQARENRRLKRLIHSLSTRLDRQSTRLDRQSARLDRQSEALALLETRVARDVPPEEAEPEPAGPAPVETGAPETPQPAPPVPPPLAEPLRARLIPSWPTLAALLVLGLAAGFLVWFSLTLDRFPPALRLGAVLLAGLTSLTLGLLTWGKRPGPGLALESWGLGLMGLSLAGTVWFTGLLSPASARAALSALGAFAAILALKQNSARLSLLVPPAFLGLWATLGPDWSDLARTAAGAGSFYLALSLATGRSSLSARRTIPALALAFFNLALAGRLFAAPPGNLSPWTGLSLVWSLEGAALFFLGRPRFGALGLGLALLAAPFIPDRFAGAPVSQFLLASAVLGGAFFQAAARTAKTKPFLVALGLVSWLVGSLASVRGLAEAQAEPFFILNWLLIVWSVFSLGLWLAGRLAPGLLISRRPGSPSLLVLAHILPLIPALPLALGFVWSFLGLELNGMSGGMDPAAWAIWSLAQGLGLAQARRLTPVAAWSNTFLLILTLALSQAAAALVKTSPAFIQDMGRLAVLLVVLALCARPPRLALFQELHLCRAAGQVLSCLALWRGLALILDPADRPGFFGFLPLLNLTNLAQAAAFWLPVVFLRRLSAPDRPPALNFFQGLLLFIWLNVALARTVHHLAGVPYQFGALFGSTIFWAVCAGVWSGLGLWAWGRRPLDPRDSELRREPISGSGVVARGPQTP